MRHDSWNLSGLKPATDDAASAHRMLREEFDTWANAGRGDTMERGHLPTAAQALDRIDFDAVRVFLDLGTGNGFAVRHAAARMSADSVAVGLDVSPRMLETARARTAEWQEERQQEGLPTAECQFVEAAFDEIPLSATSVDAAFSNEAIYYAPDVDAALKAILRVLKPGARFHCSLDHYEENRYSHDWPEKVGVPMVRASEAGWVARFEAAGLESVETARLLDLAPIAPPDTDTPEARSAHAALVAWKHEIGTLLVTGRRPE